MTDLDRAIDLEPDIAEYYYVRCCVRFAWYPSGGRLRKYDTEEAYSTALKLARADLERAIKLTPTVAKYYVARAYVSYFYDKDYVRAKRDLQHALELGHPEKDVRSQIKHMESIREMWERSGRSE
jgi:tetratricopeptide (TPR) repeat protein